MSKLKIISTFLLVALCNSVFAETLKVDLYRSGNSGSARMENARIDRDDPDVLTYKVGKVLWVKANYGGVSTFDKPPAPGKEKNWWKIPKGTVVSDKLKLVDDTKDRPNHWSWRPAQDMPYTEYVELLRETNQYFTKIK